MSDQQFKPFVSPETKMAEFRTETLSLLHTLRTNAAIEAEEELAALKRVGIGG